MRFFRVLLAAVAVVPASALGAASYGAELQGAYEYAFSKGITTMTSIDSANMYGELTRGQLAKMIANWSEAELGTKADETKVCSFTDANKAEGDLASYVKKACQMGLMGQGIAAFRPNDKVTRGEFGTTLSRALWGDKYNTTETPYYKNHLVALKDAGIMKMIDTPNQMEVRGYVMLMLQRATANNPEAACKDPLIVLACTLGSDTCPANCKKPTPDVTINTGKNAAGDLDVSVVDYSSAVKSAPKGIFVANTLKFAASEKITLDTLTLKRTGLGSQKDLKKVWLEKNGVAVTNAASVGSDGLAVLNFKSNRNVVTTNEKDQLLDLVVELDNNATVGAEFAFELQATTSSAKNATVKGMTSTYRVSAYKVVKLTANVLNRNGANAGNTELVPFEYKLGNQNDYIIGEFSLESDSSADDRDIFVKSLTFRNIGTLDFADTFKNVKVYRDSKVVSNSVEINGRDITVMLDKDVIKANRKAIYTIRAEVASLEDVSKTVQLKLRDGKDVIADENDTNFRTSIEFDANWEYKPGAKVLLSAGELGLYKFNGGKVTFESSSNFPKTVNVGVGASDVTIAKGKLVVTEPVELPKIEIPFNAVYGTAPSTDWSTNNDNAAVVADKDVIRRLVLKIGEKRYSADSDTTGKFVFSDVVIRETSDVELLISLNSKVSEGKEIKVPNLSNAVMKGKGLYQNNDSEFVTTDIAGVIQTAKVLIKKPKFTIIADAVTTQETVVNDATIKNLMKGKLEAKEKDVNVNAFKVTLRAKNALAGNVEVYLDLDGKSFANATLTKDASYTFNSLGTLKAGSSLPFELKVVPTVSAADEIYLEVRAEGTDANGNEATTSTEYSATLEVKGSADIEVTNIVASDRVVEPTPNAVLYEGELNVKNGSTTLTEFELVKNATPTPGLKVTNYKLYVDGDFVEEVAADNAASIKFAGLTHNLEQGKRKVQVKAKVESVAGNDATKYKYEITDVKVNTKASGKKANTYFAKGFFNLAKTSTSDAVLTVKLTNNSPKSIDVKAITFADGTKVASASINNQDVVIAVNEGTVAPQTVTAGSSIEIQVIAKKDELAKLTGVTYTVDDGGVYTYKLDNTIASIGSWGQFFSSK